MSRTILWGSSMTRPRQDRRDRPSHDPKSRLRIEDPGNLVSPECVTPPRLLNTALRGGVTNFATFTCRHHANNPNVKWMRLLCRGAHTHFYNVLQWAFILYNVFKIYFIACSNSREASYILFVFILIFIFRQNVLWCISYEFLFSKNSALCVMQLWFLLN